jgi:lysozyme
VKVSKKCLDMLAHHEGVRVKPYRCPAGLWTVGVGHLIGDGHSLPDSWNRTFSLKEVYDLLAQDVARFERGVERLLPNVKLSQNEFDAVVSWCFNLGLGTFQRSTFRQALLRGDKVAAMQSLRKYNKAGGKVLKGLDNRRKDEEALFNGNA